MQMLLQEGIKKVFLPVFLKVVVVVKVLGRTNEQTQVLNKTENKLNYLNVLVLKTKHTEMEYLPLKIKEDQDQEVVITSPRKSANHN